MKSRICALALIALAQCVLAFNHPELKWKTVKTEHFSINYYDKTEPAVYAVWKIAEEAYAQLAPLYQFEYDQKINISIADYDDHSNGWAAFLDPSVMLWLPDSRFDLRSNATWLRNLVTHELTHIFSLERKKSMQVVAIDLGLEYGYQSPDFDAQTSYQIPFPRMTFYPAWFTEGVAQNGASRLKCDCWDSRRDMVLRCAILDNKQLSLDEMGHFSHDQLGNEMVYNQGFSFVDFLQRRFGAPFVQKLCADGGRSRFDFSRAFAARAGVSLDDTYALWIREATARYSTTATKVPTKTEWIFHRGTASVLPRVSPHGKRWGWIASDRDAGYRSDLLIGDYGNNTPHTRIAWAHTAWCFSPDEKSVYYVKSRSPDQNGSFFNDLYRYDFGSSHETRITRGARVYDVAVAPDNETMVLVRYNDGSFNLYQCAVNGTGMRLLSPAPLGTPFASPVFPPDRSNEIVVARITAGNSDLVRVALSTSEITPLTTAAAQEESPYWGRDGRIYYSADADGIFNIYSVLPDGSDCVRHTQVVGGAFSPCLDTKNNLLVSEYVSSGFGIARCAVQQLLAPAPSGTETCLYQDIPRPSGTVRIKSTPYKPKYLRSVWEIYAQAQLVQSDTLANTSDQNLSGAVGGGFMLSRHDAIDKKSLSLGVLAGIPFARDIETGIAGFGIENATRPGWFFDSLPNHHEYVCRDQSVRDRMHKKIPGTVPGLARAGAEEDSSGSAAMPLMLVLQPVVSYRNNAGRASFGTDFMLSMPFGVPVGGLFSPFASGQLSRDWYWGITPDIVISPFNRHVKLYGTIPVWFEWYTVLAADEDMRYNARQFARVQLTLAPELDRHETVTAWNIGSFDNPVPAYDTIISAERAVAAQLDGNVSVPLYAHASLLLGAQAELRRYENEVTDRDRNFAGKSNTFGTYAGGVDFLFPLARNINRGTLFVDNLYGRIGYFHIHKTDDSWFKKDETLWADYLSAGLDMGMTKNFSFSRTLSLYGYYEPRNRYGGISLSLM